jgi:uncharacterized peroxidase-related enzyme
MVSGMRLPDAARVALYHKNFFGVPMGAWTQATMRGPSPWSVAERELMACLVAEWNACPFCVGAHGAVAAKEMQRPAVDEAISDFRTAPISGELKSALVFLEVMTQHPKDLKPEHATAALSAGLSPQALTDAIAVGALFSIVTRYANALDFAMPSPEEFERAANMLLKRGYAS